MSTETPRRHLGTSTQSVHGGEPRTKAANAITTPIIQSATFTFANTAELCDYFEGRIERDEYGRYGNPTQRIAEGKLAALDGGAEALLLPTLTVRRIRRVLMHDRQQLLDLRGGEQWIELDVRCGAHLGLLLHLSISVDRSGVTSGRAEL